MKQKSKKIKWILCAICAFVFLTCSPLRAEASTGGKSADDAINCVKFAGWKRTGLRWRYMEISVWI